MVGFGLFVAALVICLAIVLPIVAIVRTGRIRHLELRLAGVEAALLRLTQQSAPAQVTPVEAQVATAPPPPPAEVPVERPAVEPLPAPLPAPRPAEHLETVIGQKWVGWVAVVLIFFAVGFFLKYAFENRWIGELGRVALGVAVGLVLVWNGLQRHRKGWRYLSQVFTGGGITILYL
ncbi:MAG TPA: DUF2339 domain-containing protein, partial [Bryobacteraceae bacterium]